MENNYKIRNANYLKNENIKKSFLNNFVNRKNENKNFIYLLNPKYDSKSKKIYLRNIHDKNINQKIKKIETIILYINNYKRRPRVYTQIDSIKLDKNFIPNINNSN